MVPDITLALDKQQQRSCFLARWLFGVKSIEHTPNNVDDKDPSLFLFLFSLPNKVKFPISKVWQTFQTTQLFPPIRRNVTFLLSTLFTSILPVPQFSSSSTQLLKLRVKNQVSLLTRTADRWRSLTLCSIIPRDGEKFCINRLSLCLSYSLDGVD